MTPAACSSSGRRSPMSVISPSPSIGLARASTVRPRYPSPTGTERMSPVRLTTWPSSMPPDSPITTTPISRTSRFSAMPSVPFSNSRSSLAIAEGRPSTRAIPSPDVTTVPTSSRLAVSGVYPRTKRSSASRISSGRIVSSAMACAFCSISKVDLFSCDVTQACYLKAVLSKEPSGRLEPVRNGPFKHLIAELNPNSSQDVRIDDFLDCHLPADLLTERGSKTVPLIGGERLCNAYGRHCPVLLCCGQRDVTLDRLPEGTLT